MDGATPCLLLLVATSLAIARCRVAGFREQGNARCPVRNAETASRRSVDPGAVNVKERERLGAYRMNLKACL